MNVEELRVLTVKQPNASAIVAGLKDVENRRRECPVRGIIAIHAGVSVDQLGNETQLDLPRGFIIGVVRVAACLPGTSTSPWARPGHWHWELRDARRLETPVKCRGQQALFHPPAEIARAVLEQL